MRDLFLSLSAALESGPDRRALFTCCHAEKSDSLVYGCRKLWRSEERQLLSRHLIHPHRGSSSLSPRNLTPGQATGTEQGNARNPLNPFAHCFARSRPYGDVKSAAGSEVRRPGANRKQERRQESESSWMEVLSPGQHNKDPIIYFCHSPCQMKSNPTTRSLIKGSGWLSWRVTNKYECQE